jgi:hypothetical protein
VLGTRIEIYLYVDSYSMLIHTLWESSILVAYELYDMFLRPRCRIPSLVRRQKCNTMKGRGDYFLLLPPPRLFRVRDISPVDTGTSLMHRRGAVQSSMVQSVVLSLEG